MPKAGKHHGDQDYATILRYGCKNEAFRIQEKGDTVTDLQCTGGLENDWSRLLSLAEGARKRLGEVSSLEDASKWDFDLTLFP